MRSDLRASWRNPSDRTILEVNLSHAPVEDVRALRDRGDNLGVRLDTKIDAVWLRLDAKIDALASRTEARFDALASRTEARFDALADSIATAKVWALLLYITLATATFGTMARAFGWL